MICGVKLNPCRVNDPKAGESASTRPGRYTLLGIEHILVGIHHLPFVLPLVFFNIGVELGQLIFLFAVLAIMALLRYAAEISWDSAAFLKAERAMVYVIGVLASYWLIERGLEIFPPLR